MNLRVSASLRFGESREGAYLSPSSENKRRLSFTPFSSSSAAELIPAAIARALKRMCVSSGTAARRKKHEQTHFGVDSHSHRRILFPRELVFFDQGQLSLLEIDRVRRLWKTGVGVRTRRWGMHRGDPALVALTKRFLTPVLLLPPPPARSTVLSSVQATE
jgi:hypothetical protein